MSSGTECIRKASAGLVIVVGIVVVTVVFWQQELKYSLPTSLPHNYIEVQAGAQVQLPGSLAKDVSYFFHFYNPDCPCSRFNARHIKTLIGNYRDSIRFVIVVSERESLEEAKNEFGEDLQYLHDEDQLIAKACGVYSTPQAAIITSEQKLFYRGNYNRARYCTIRASNFAELSLIALINHQPAPVFELAATQAYGCELDENEIEFF